MLKILPKIQMQRRKMIKFWLVKLKILRKRSSWKEWVQENQLNLLKFRWSKYIKSIKSWKPFAKIRDKKFVKNCWRTNWQELNRRKVPESKVKFHFLHETQFLKSRNQILDLMKIMIPISIKTWTNLQKFPIGAINLTRDKTKRKANNPKSSKNQYYLWNSYRSNKASKFTTPETWTTISTLEWKVMPYMLIGGKRRGLMIL